MAERSRRAEGEEIRGFDRVSHFLASLAFMGRLGKSRENMPNRRLSIADCMSPLLDCYYIQPFNLFILTLRSLICRQIFLLFIVIILCLYYALV